MDVYRPIDHHIAFDVTQSKNSVILSAKLRLDRKVKLPNASDDILMPMIRDQRSRMVEQFKKDCLRLSGFDDQQRHEIYMRGYLDALNGYDYHLPRK